MKRIVKISLTIGALVAPVATVVSCEAARLPNPNRPVPTLKELQDKHGESYGSIDKIDVTALPDDQRIFGVASAFFRTWKRVKFYIKGDTPAAKEYDFASSFVEIRVIVDKCLSTPQYTQFAKDAWGVKVHGEHPEFDPLPTRVVMTKQKYLDFLEAQSIKYDGGYKWFIDQIYNDIKTKL